MSVKDVHPLAKAPPNIPEGKIDERVTLRANSARHGTITRFNETMMWAFVKWDDGKQAPKICHQYELKRLPIDEQQKTVV